MSEARSCTTSSRWTDGRVVGTAQLRLAQQSNAPHRAEVAKVLVHRDARRLGLGSALMDRVEEIARRHQRTLLVLDTIAGGYAVRLHERLGWTRAGEIPPLRRVPRRDARADRDLLQGRRMSAPDLRLEAQEVADPVACDQSRRRSRAARRGSGATSTHRIGFPEV